MGYNIEISFNITKQRSVNETQNYVIDLAREYSCNFYYVDFELENIRDIKRNHCVITVNFEDCFTNNMNDFLTHVKNNKNHKYYIETIYNDVTNKYIYASRYYLIQNTNKSFTNEYFINKKSKKYSDEENSILKTIGKSL